MLRIKSETLTPRRALCAAFAVGAAAMICPMRGIAQTIQPATPADHSEQMSWRVTLAPPPSAFAEGNAREEVFQNRHGTDFASPRKLAFAIGADITLSKARVIGFGNAALAERPFGQKGATVGLFSNGTKSGVRLNVPF